MSTDNNNYTHTKSLTISNISVGHSNGLSSWPAGTGCRLGPSSWDRDQVIDSLEAGEVDPDDPGIGSPVTGELVTTRRETLPVSCAWSHPVSL